jgi:hypothetical protein
MKRINIDFLTLLPEMKRFKTYILYFLSLALVGSSCNVLKNTNSEELNDGFYTQHWKGTKSKVYLNNDEDDLNVYPYEPKSKYIDTNSATVILHEKQFKNSKNNFLFNKHDLDIDLFTIPLKFRPTTNGLPAQLNTTLNGSLYVGYRTDHYLVNYVSKPVGNSIRNVNHFGFSLGGFSGIGNTFMSPTNTNNILQQEYDGIVWSKGTAGIFDLNNFTIGLALGFDHLLDINNDIWTYQAKPWLGLAFCINVN